jgi:hypothetical protein
VLRKLAKEKNNSFDLRNFLKFTFGFFSPLLICLGSSVKGRGVLKTSGFFKSFRSCVFNWIDSRGIIYLERCFSAS